MSWQLVSLIARIALTISRISMDSVVRSLYERRHLPRLPASRPYSRIRRRELVHLCRYAHWLRSSQDPHGRKCEGVQGRFDGIQASKSTAFPFIVMLTFSEHHDWCSRRLGAYPKGYPHQSRSVRWTQKVGLQLGCRGQAGGSVLPHSAFGWIDGCCGLQAGEVANRRSTEICL
jgi:hypothetical protein